MSFSPNIFVLISIEYFKALHNLLFVIFWWSITHVVKHLIPDFRAFIFSKLEDSLPEKWNIAFNLTGAHLLTGLESDSLIFTLCELN